LYSIEGETTVRYKIIISNEEKLSFKAVLKVVNESTSKESFSDVLLINNEIKKPKTRIGSEIATTDEGLIETVDNKGTSYYFRGNVKNNYVKLGDLLFRIVRINGDGTVRMVLDGVIENQYPYNTNEPTEEVSPSLLSGLGYSTVLGELNNWYNEKLGAYDMYLANTDFCTDTSFNRELNGIYYSNSFDRIFVDGAPDLYCSGTIYTGKVGLLSADEVLLAGAYADVTNSDFYLYNSEIKGNYVTNSSYSMVEGRAHMINVMANGAFGDSVDIGTETFIRPVVSMGTSAKLKGDGTKSNPYIIVA
jgi:hypothetical protein